MRRHLVLAVLAIGMLLGAVGLTQAAGATVTYQGVQRCYVVGRTIPTFTLTARVSASNTYRITHAVLLNNQSLRPAEVVYEGPITGGTSKTVAIVGGTAAVPGTYTLIGRLYLSASGVLVAQTTVNVLLADPCPSDATPVPITTPAPAEDEADIRWSQSATPAPGVPPGAVLTVVVRGKNVGRGSGRSDAILGYDPRALQLRDVLPAHPDDWVRARDDRQGTITLALGTLAPDEARSLTVHFLVIGAPSNTTLTLTRDDGQDRGNPLFVEIGRYWQSPILLIVNRTPTGLSVRGRGYKPGETLALWSNNRDGTTTAIATSERAHDDADGSITIEMADPGSAVEALVVQGLESDVTGVGRIPNN